MKDRLIDLSLDRHRSTMLVMLGILIFGIVARVSIPVESEPRIEVPFFVVTMVHEGVSPEDATRLLIMPLEIELKSVEGVKKITGTGAEHMATVAVEFTTETDLAGVGAVDEHQLFRVVVDPVLQRQIHQHGAGKYAREFPFG